MHELPFPGQGEILEMDLIWRKKDWTTSVICDLKLLESETDNTPTFVAVDFYFNKHEDKGTFNGTDSV